MQYKEVKSIVDTAINNGINFLDIFMAEANVRSNIGNALAGRRKDIVIQGHLGAVINNNQPAVSRDLNSVKSFFDDFLTRMKTDYVDIGYLHFVDRLEELQIILDGSIAKYALSLKKSKVIHLIGLSTHNIDVAITAINSGLIDCLMFPINPAFDLMPKSQNIFDIFDKEKHAVNNWYTMQVERQKLYDLCLEKEIALVAMKPLGGGMLLNKQLSPFQIPLSVQQCIEYCLSNAAVTTAMVGCKNVNEVVNLKQYYNIIKNHTNVFDALASSSFQKDKLNCMYCNHCLPCPQHIDIAAVIKYYDIARASEGKHNYIANHYFNLKHKASDCIKCYKCVERCPFGIKIVDYMTNITEFFGQ